MALVVRYFCEPRGLDGKWMRSTAFQIMRHTCTMIGEAGLAIAQ